MKPVIVLDGHTLGVVFPNGLQVLHSSVLRGSPYTIDPGLIGFDPVLQAGRYRPATHQDFSDFGVADPDYYLAQTS
jgi:hypothetical protein